MQKMARLDFIFVKYLFLTLFSGCSANIYLFKYNNRNTRKCEICPRLTINTPKRPDWRCSGVLCVIVICLCFKKFYFRQGFHWPRESYWKYFIEFLGNKVKNTCVCVSGGKKCSYFGKCSLLFRVTPVLRFALLPYCRRIIIFEPNGNFLNYLFAQISFLTSPPELPILNWPEIIDKENNTGYPKLKLN